jgi:hypothetical protein
MRTIALAIILGVASLTLSYAGEVSATTNLVKPVQDKSGQSDPSISPGQGEGFRIIRGEVLKMEGNSYLVKDETGKEVRMMINNGTKVDKAFEVGDTIIAQVSDQGIVTVITKSAEAPTQKK